MRKCGIVVFFFVLFCVSCSSSKLPDDTALKAIRETLNLADDVKIEILGTAKEQIGTTLVKYKYYKKTHQARFRKYDRGWQLEQIQNEKGEWTLPEEVVKAPEVATDADAAYADVKLITNALASLVTDTAQAPPHHGSFAEYDDIYKLLCPFHAETLPLKDPWDGDYLIFTGTAIDGKYGIAGSKADAFMVVCLGKDGEAEDWTYDPSAPAAGLYTEKDSGKDFVTLNGSFIRGLKKS